MRLVIVVTDLKWFVLLQDHLCFGLWSWSVSWAEQWYYLKRSNDSSWKDPKSKYFLQSNKLKSFLFVHFLNIINKFQKKKFDSGKNSKNLFWKRKRWIWKNSSAVIKFFSFHHDFITFLCWSKNETSIQHEKIKKSWSIWNISMEKKVFFQ